MIPRIHVWETGALSSWRSRLPLVAGNWHVWALLLPCWSYRWSFCWSSSPTAVLTTGHSADLTAYFSAGPSASVTADFSTRPSSSLTAIFSDGPSACLTADFPADPSASLTADFFAGLLVDITVGPITAPTAGLSAGPPVDLAACYSYSLLHRWGFYVGLWPKVVITVTVLVAAAMSSGMVFFEEENMPEKLWLPTRSEVSKMALNFTHKYSEVLHYTRNATYHFVTVLV